VSETLAQYTPRAANYDKSHGGWHAVLAHDFVSWLPGPDSGAVLDLACGTGLLSLEYAQMVGPEGVVLGVDMTEAMLHQARQKTRPSGAAEVHWILGDITNLASLPEVTEIAKARGGFDVISCCSALVLLQDPLQAIQSWVPYLKPKTGKIIIDVPTERRNLQYLLNYSLRQALGNPMAYKLDWVQSAKSLEDIYRAAGLGVVKTIHTSSYIPAKWYEANQALEVFEEKTANSGLWKNMAEAWKEHGGIEHIKQVWQQIWQSHLDEEGKLWEGNCLYVTIGKRGD
jgi:ubiquinone/menaquinone biosynthesis C-methylase UbiE